MLMFSGRLVDVQVGDYNSLIFRAEKYDFRLKERVVYGESISIPNELLDVIPNFKKHIGENVLIGIRAILTKDKKMFFMADSDVIDTEELLV